jgi:hypothetical protein
VALRSVVVEAPASPPAPRRTVVVRPGAPKPKGRALDIAVGVIGVLLLVAAFALAEVLPDKTYLNPQFRLTFELTDVETERSQFGTLLEDAAGGPTEMEFLYEVTDDNVASVSLIVGFTDDVSFSLPDRFEVTLTAPNGTTFTNKLVVENKPPKGPASPLEGGTFETIELTGQFSTTVPPSEGIVTGLSPTETPEQVLARLAPQHFVATKGTWVVRVTLIAAGDCPEPGQETYNTQSRDCRFGPPAGSAGDASASPDGQDPGNEVILSTFKYTYFTPTIKELA